MHIYIYIYMYMHMHMYTYTYMSICKRQAVYKTDTASGKDRPPHAQHTRIARAAPNGSSRDPS